jgi:hypothetical protein
MTSGVTQEEEPNMPEGKLSFAGLVLVPGRIAGQGRTNRYNQISMSGEKKGHENISEVFTRFRSRQLGGGHGKREYNNRQLHANRGTADGTR